MLIISNINHNPGEMQAGRKRLQRIKSDPGIRFIDLAPTGCYISPDATGRGSTIVPEKQEHIMTKACYAGMPFLEAVAGPTAPN
jgi:hypothetical protein